ncbi:MAG: gfo/Idh/MocA family oxidoreductase, partial [Spirochaetaceae bacterium]|nr:gfo/Idh/MocA family oxidoreductase [Spirochaetaceae bacterium]
YVEVRKNVDAGNPAGGPCVILVNHDEERTITFDGSEPFPFFGRMILDCLHRTEEAMTQEHAFAVAELTLQAQAVADSHSANPA